MQRHLIGLFLAMVLVLNLPNLVPLDQGGSQVMQLELFERLAVCLVLAALVLCLFRRPWCAWAVLWSTCLWWQPLALAVRAINGTPISASLVGMALATNAGELRSIGALVSPAWWVLLATWNLACGLVLWILRRRVHGVWSRAFRVQTAVLGCSLLIIPWLVLARPWRPAVASPARPQAFSDQFRQADRPVGSVPYLAEAFPFELPWSLAQYWQAWRVVEAASNGLLRVPAAQRIVLGAGAPDVVVLVIGESSSRSAWHLFNAQAPATTPELERRHAEGTLFPLRNVVAQNAATRQSVPSMLTAQPLLWPDGSANPQATHSIVAAAGAGGYTSAWFSNQGPIGQYDGVIATYAREADAIAFLNPSSYQNQGSHDGVLLPALETHLQQHRRAFVVLHIMGSHINFAHRYPAGFGPFPAPATVHEEYANSVAYTDWFLDRVIAVLEHRGGSAVLVYVSDHGQALPDARCGRSTINRMTHDAYEVPALVWLSAAYQVAQPWAVARLKAHENSPYTVDAVHQSLRDLIQGEPQSAAGEAAGPSFLRTPDAGQARLVAFSGKRWFDYDQAAARNPCFIRPE